MVMARHFAAFCLILATALAANAASVTFSAPTGASNYIEGKNAGDTPIIYGAIAGPLSNCVNSLTTTTFCNNCNGDIACSERRIHGNLRLRIPFTVTTETAGYIHFGLVDGGNYQPIATNVTRSTNDQVSKGASGYVEVPWGVICDAYAAKLGASDPNCDNNINSINNNMFVAISPDNSISAEEASPINIRIFTPPHSGSYVENSEISCIDDPPRDGVCSFRAGPGDEKVYIDPIDVTGTYPTVDNVPIRALRLFYATAGNVTDINYTNPYIDMNIDSTGRPDPDNAKGLTNDIYHGFKIAIIDDAYNVALLTSDAQVALACPGGSTIDAAGDATCDYVTLPSNVIGLLSDDFNCFISTAAYGSSMAPKVRTFREFRNQFLLRTKWGKTFVQSYYAYGPYAARFVHDYPAFKPVARVLLWPLWAFAALALKYGLAAAVAAFSTFLFVLIFAAHRLKTSHRWRRA